MKERIYKKLTERLNKLLEKSKQLKHTIESAKTKLKKEFYTKKLKKNNEEMYKTIISLELINPTIKKDEA